MKVSMGTALKASLVAAGLATLPSVANAATTMLAATDYVGISFWTISMAMMAAAIFFLMEAGRLPGKWKTAMTIGALVQIVAVSAGIFWRLMIGSLVMLVAGYLGEAGLVNAWLGFVVGMAGWAYILYEIFAGEAGKVSAESAPEAVQKSFGTMRMIVTVGWAIYPLGYFLGYLNGAADAVTLNVIYNVADVVNKIAFVGVIWAAANAEAAKA